MEFIELIKTFGLPVALVVIFIIRDIWREKKDNEREQELQDRFSGLEEFCRNQLLEVAKESTEAVKESSEVIRQNSDILAQVKDRIKVSA